MGDLIIVVLVIALLGAAAALATPPGRLPLALRGVYRILRKDRGESAAPPDSGPVPLWRRVLAFVLVVIAALLVLA
ncbi:MAG: hypothetical protein IJQ54_04770 [Kiritimatiellae bacterium]|nr:hypothetical protein [Kiritimatiellia bacterium]